MKLSTEDKDNLTSSQFAGPGRTYPIPDDSHAEAAIRDSAHAEYVGNISKSTEESIDAKARAKLREDGKGGDPPAHDHKAAVAKMHHEHVHKLVQDAAAGKYGDDAKHTAQQALEPTTDGQIPEAENTSMPKRRSGARDIFGPPSSSQDSGYGTSDDDADDEEDARPATARGIFGR